MSSVNKVIILGRLAADPTIRATNDGREIGSMTVVTSERWKDKHTGERKEKAEFHRVSVMSEGLVNVCKRYLNKGSQVYIEGQIQTRKWTDKDGADRYTTEIVLSGFNSQLVMLDKAEQSTHDKQKQDGYQPQDDLNDDLGF